MPNSFISIVVIVVIVGGGFLLFNNRSVAPTEVELDTNMPVLGSEVEEMEVIKEFTVDAGSFYFAPNVMSVNFGDTVKINVTNVGGTHDLRLDDFNIGTQILSAGQEATITFVADKMGSFEYYCSVGNHRTQGMVGTLLVN